MGHIDPQTNIATTRLVKDKQEIQDNYILNLKPKSLIIILFEFMIFLYLVATQMKTKSRSSCIYGPTALFLFFLNNTSNAIKKKKRHMTNIFYIL